MEYLDEEKRALLRLTPRLPQLVYLNPEGQSRQGAVRVIQEVSHQWKSLAVRLHFKEEVVQIIAANHPNDYEAACSDMFMRWLQGMNGTRRPVTWETLIRSLYETHSSFKALGDKLVQALYEVRANGPVHSLGIQAEDQPHGVQVDDGPVPKEGKYHLTGCEWVHAFNSNRLQPYISSIIASTCPSRSLVYIP